MQAWWKKVEENQEDILAMAKMWSKKNKIKIAELIRGPHTMVNAKELWRLLSDVWWKAPDNHHILDRTPGWWDLVSLCEDHPGDSFIKCMEEHGCKACDFDGNKCSKLS